MFNIYTYEKNQQKIEKQKNEKIKGERYEIKRKSI